MKKILLIGSEEFLSASQTVPENAYNKILYLNVQREILDLNSGSFDEVILKSILPDENLQAEIFRVLKSKAKLLVEGVESREIGQNLAIELKIQGFVDIMAAKDPLSGERFVVCQKPEWDIGISASITIPTTQKVSSWKLTDTDEINTSNEDLVDENDLLAGEELSIPPRGDSASCGEDGEISSDGRKRACKNCTCGLAEIEATEGQIQRINNSLTEVSKSSCGNCYKGDAFRCASCPFLGKPAFEPGQEKVVLSLGQDDI